MILDIRLSEELRHFARSDASRTEISHLASLGLAILPWNSWGRLVPSLDDSNIRCVQAFQNP